MSEPNDLLARADHVIVAPALKLPPGFVDAIEHLLDAMLGPRPERQQHVRQETET